MRYDAETVKMVEEVYQDIDRETREEEARYLNDQGYALKALVRAVNYANESGEKPLPAPVRVLEVLGVSIGQSLRRGSFWLRARCERADGVTDVIEFESSSDSGDRECPPEHEECVRWETIGDDGEPIEYESFFVVTRNPEKKDPARQAKAEWFYKVFRRHGLRCRMHENSVQVPMGQHNEALVAVGRYVSHLKDYDPIFSKDVY